MIAFLRSDAARKPETLAAGPAAADAATGTVVADIAHGELFLRRQGSDRPVDLRLRFDGEGETSRALPAGTYAVLGYRHVARDADGVTWIWSTTSPGYRRLEIEAGARTRLDVRQRIEVRARAFRAKNGQHRVGLIFVAEEKLGHTLYRDGARIGIRWQCLDDEDAVLAEGAMEYG